MTVEVDTCDRLTSLISVLQKEITNLGIDANKGIPRELFLLISSLSPVPNVDLFVTDTKKRFLLSWRNDEYFGSGWHIPGGCIRLRESFEERIQKTAISELGTNVICNMIPALTVESIVDKDIATELGNYLRPHNISVLFECHLPNNYSIEEFNRGKSYLQNGYLKWFESLPNEFLTVQKPLYKDYIEAWTKREL